MNTQNTQNTDDAQNAQYTHNTQSSGFVKKTTGYVIGPCSDGPSGEDVGKLMLKDLCWTWELMNAGSRETPHSRDIFSAEEKAMLVGQLHTEEDFRDYNVYREIHAALVRMPERFSLARTRAELAFWRLHALVLNVHQVEREHAQSCNQPRVLTERQYDALRAQYGPQQLAALCPGGVALLQEGSPHIGPDGCYSPPGSPRSCDYAAEQLLSRHSGVIRALFHALRVGMRECYALLEGMRLIAERVEVPELEHYILERPPEEDVALLNHLIEDLPPQIVRFNRGQLGINEQATNELREEVKELLRPVGLDELRPSPQAVERARAFLGDLTVIYRDANRLFKLLEEGSL